MVDTQNWNQLAHITLCRILDANLDRAREGLRIVEEWCRFGINSAALTEECKDMRQKLARLHSQELRAARNTPEDPGTELTHAQEESRSTIQQVLQANLCRTQEALRVLEEYGKLYQAGMGETCKQLRYRVYTLESQLLVSLRHQKLSRSYLYLVTCPSDRLFETVEAALQSGLTLVQYRDKDMADEIRFKNAQRLCQLCHSYDALFIVNDRVDIALAVEADGVHLGQQDLEIDIARRLLGPERIIGMSTTNPDEMQRAIQGGADYIGVGPVYETPTKAGKASVGLDYIRRVAEQVKLPWFAIGGIDLPNVNDVLTAGAERVAVVRAIMQAEQPALITQYLVSQLNRVQIMRNHATRVQASLSS